MLRLSGSQRLYSSIFRQPSIPKLSLSSGATMNGYASSDIDAIPPPPPSDFIPPPPASDDLPPAPPEELPPAPPSDDLPPPPPSDPAELAPPPKKKKGWAAPKKEPLSIEEILRKKREADAAAAKVSIFP